MKTLRETLDQRDRFKEEHPDDHMIEYMDDLFVISIYMLQKDLPFNKVIETCNSIIGHKLSKDGKI